MNPNDTGNIINAVLGLFKALIVGIITFPAKIPILLHKLLCLMRLDAPIGMLTNKLRNTKVGHKLSGTEVDKTDPDALLAWLEEQGRKEGDIRVDFDRLPEYRESEFPRDKYEYMHIPTPANLERGIYFYDKLPNGKPKTWAIETHYANPALLASAYDKTAKKAATYAVACLFPVVLLCYYFLGGAIGIDATTTESWGSLGGVSSFAPLSLAWSLIVSLVVIAICVAPFLAVFRVERLVHDVIARSEFVSWIKVQMESLGSNVASKASISLYDTHKHEIEIFADTRKNQLNEYARVYNNGEAMVELHQDDGTARARGSLFGYEAGTKMMISISELCQNLYGSGAIGTGKTRTTLLPILRSMVKAFKENGLPIQGMFLDGKADLYHSVIKILKEEGLSTDNFKIIGVGDDEYGLDVFANAPVDLIMSRIQATVKGDPDPHFDVLAIDFMRNMLNITRVADILDVGIAYYEKTGGTMSSPSFIRLCANSPQTTFDLVDTVLAELHADEALMRDLYDTNIQTAIEGILNDWSNYQKAQEMLSGVVSCVNKYLGPFVNNGKIRDKFGSGKKGPGYLDVGCAFNGDVIFSNIPDSVFGETSRVINSFARSDLFERATTRQVEYSKIGKDPMSEPVLVIIDEHGALVSSGVSTSTDQGALNQSRSKGIIFQAYTQSRESYEMLIGPKQTDNMTQQMLTRYYLPTKSEADIRWIADTMGSRYKISVQVEGVYPTEGAREMHNGCVMKEPYTSIDEAKKQSDFGFPVGLSLKGDDFTVYPSVEYKGSWEALTGSTLEGELVSSGDSEKALQVFSMNMQRQDRYADKEEKFKSDGLEILPLFTNDDFHESGRYYALVSAQQYGIEHRCRVAL